MPQVCRCLPFIQRLHKLDEVASVRELRAMVKTKFSEFRDVKDPRVSACHADKSGMHAEGCHHHQQGLDWLSRL